MKIKLLFWSLLYLFGTFLHEFSHFGAALLFGKPEGFSVVPRLERGSFIFGEVRARVRYKVLSVFISSAPLMWWVLLLLTVKHLLSVNLSYDIHRLNITMLSERLKSVTLRDVLALWLVFQLLWAGRLSMQDIKTCFRGIISPSGLLLLVIIVLLAQIFRYIS